MKFTLSICFLLLCSVVAQAQQTATTAEGKKVILDPNGTWKYAEASSGVTLKIEAGLVYVGGNVKPVARRSFALLAADPTPELMRLPRAGEYNFNGIQQLAQSCWRDSYPEAPAIIRKHTRYTFTTGLWRHYCRGYNSCRHATIYVSCHNILFVGKEGLTIQRFENLGEMNPQQLWESALDPEKRALLQVKIEDAVKADELYTAMMGEQIESRSVHGVIDGLSEAMIAVKEDVKEIKRDLKDLARSFNTLAAEAPN